LLRKLELNRPLRLALQDHRSLRNPVALVDVADAKADEVTPSQLAVDGQIEERQFPRSLRQL
jgi:hypothetical protein